MLFINVYVGVQEIFYIRIRGQDERWGQREQRERHVRGEQSGQ